VVIIEAIIIFPNQLFIEPTQNQTLVYIEDALFFKRDDILFHKQKILLHKLSMNEHFNQYDKQAKYFTYPSEIDTIKTYLKQFDTVLGFEPNDHELKEKYSDIPIKWLETPNFINKTSDIEAYFNNKSSYFMHYFYVHQRKKHNILMENGKPVGDQYSFDQENRKKLPKDIEIPPPLTFHYEKIDEWKHWVDVNFRNHPGDLSHFNYPINKSQAQKQLDYFFTHKFKLFGPYQDALSEKDPFLFHSNLSSSLNIGLLDPKTIIHEALKQEVPMASKEGFIRQILGWREFIRALYLLEGKALKNANHLSHKNRLNDAWVNGSTFIPIVDRVIDKLNQTAYAHHIERLMVIGNIMFLLNIHPKDVYRYFMAMHIDAYEWVMVPNIFGMSQFSKGDIMTSKPYFSGANYLHKMGVKKGPWSEQWDALFYMFLRDQRGLIEKNPRLKLLLNNLDKKDQTTINQYSAIKKDLLTRLTQ